MAPLVTSVVTSYDRKTEKVNEYEINESGRVADPGQKTLIGSKRGVNGTLQIFSHLPDLGTSRT